MSLLNLLVCISLVFGNMPAISFVEHYVSNKKQLSNAVEKKVCLY